MSRRGGRTLPSLALAATLLGGAAAEAQPAPEAGRAEAAARPESGERRLVVALYAPNSPFSSGSERFNYVNRLAQHLSAATGLPFEGKAFARAADFEAALGSKQLDYAVVDGVYLAERSVPFQVLAAAVSGGEIAPRWGLFGKQAQELKSLEGKRLSVAKTGERDDDFIGNALLDGELQVRKFFGSRQEAPDLAAAVAAVQLNKADVVCTLLSEGKGLALLLDVGRVPNPAFVSLGSAAAQQGSAERSEKLREALLSFGGGGGLDGWQVTDAAPYRQLASRLSVRLKRPLMTEPLPVKLDEAQLIIFPPFEPAQPDLRPLFVRPASE
jgi:hypothetical protein